MRNFFVVFVFFFVICYRCEAFFPSVQNYTGPYTNTKLFTDLQNDIKPLGYDLDLHVITTEDGYILKLFRVKNPNAYNLKPVVLFHGLFGCGDAWFIKENISLPFLLAKKGYDVWVMNSRGTQHSLDHLWLNNTGKDYWFFSFQEVAKYDCPAIIDYVLLNNRHLKVAAIGHSSGTTQLFVFLSILPEYNDKIEIHIQLTPSAVFEYFDLDWHRSVARGVDFWIKLADHIKWYSMWPWGYPNIRNTLQEICSIPLFHNICKIGFVSLGEEGRQLKELEILDVFKRVPCGGALREVFHYMQALNHGRIRYFDYGPKENLKRYNSTEPPPYDFGKITSKCALIYGTGDEYVTPPDVVYLSTLLPNVVYMKEVMDDGWTHLDFIMGRDAYTAVYKDIIKILRIYY